MPIFRTARRWPSVKEFFALFGTDDGQAPRVNELGSAAFQEIGDLWRWPTSIITGNVTLTADDNHRLFLVTSAATLTLPPEAEIPDDWRIAVKARGATATVARASTDTIDGGTSVALTTGLSAFVTRSGTGTFETF